MIEWRALAPQPGDRIRNQLEMPVAVIELGGCAGVDDQHTAGAQHSRHLGDDAAVQRIAVVRGVGQVVQDLVDGDAVDRVDVDVLVFTALVVEEVALDEDARRRIVDLEQIVVVLFSTLVVVDS